MGEFVAGGQGEEFVSVLGQQILVGGNYRLTLLEGGAQELPGIAGATHGFDDHINVWVLEKIFPVSDGYGSDRDIARRNAGAAADAVDGQLYSRALGDQVAMLGDDVSGGTAYGSESDNADANLFFSHGRCHFGGQHLKAHRSIVLYGAPEGAP